MVADYQVIHMRIIVTFMEAIQNVVISNIKGDKTGQLALFRSTDTNGNYRVEVPLKNFGVNPNNYPLLKQAMKDLTGIRVELPVSDPVVGNRALFLGGLFNAIIPEKYGRMCAFEIDPRVAEAIVDTNRGYTKFIKETVMGISNKMAVKLYLKCCSWLSKGGFSITIPNLRKWLCIEDKYTSYKDLNKLLKSAQKCLEEKANCWFSFSPVYRNNEKEPYKINFKIFRNAYTVEEQAEIDRTGAQMKELWFRHFGFGDTECENLFIHFTLYNLDGIKQKTVELYEYVMNNKSKIKDVKKYCFDSLMNYFLPSGDGFIEDYLKQK